MENVVIGHLYSLRYDYNRCVFVCLCEKLEFLSIYSGSGIELITIVAAGIFLHSLAISLFPFIDLCVIMKIILSFE